MIQPFGNSTGLDNSCKKSKKNEKKSEKRKMSHSHSNKFLKNGGKCPTVILTSVQTKKENSDNFSQKGGKCPTAILTRC